MGRICFTQGFVLDLIRFRKPLTSYLWSSPHRTGSDPRCSRCGLFDGSGCMQPGGIQTYGTGGTESSGCGAMPQRVVWTQLESWITYTRGRNCKMIVWKWISLSTQVFMLFPNGHLIFQHFYSHCGAKDWLSGRAVSKARLDLLTLNFQWFSLQNKLQQCGMDQFKLMTHDPLPCFERTMDFWKAQSQNLWWTCRTRSPAHEHDRRASDMVDVEGSPADYVDYAKLLQEKDPGCLEENAVAYPRAWVLVLLCFIFLFSVVVVVCWEALIEVILMVILHVGASVLFRTKDSWWMDGVLSSMLRVEDFWRSIGESWHLREWRIFPLSGSRCLRLSLGQLWVLCYTSFLCLLRNGIVL